MKKVLAVLLISILVIPIVSCSSNLGTQNNEELKKQDPNIISSTQNKTDNNVESNKPKEVVNESWVSSASKKDEILMEGTINNDLKIHMSIQIKDGKVQGSYYYDKYKADIQLKGDIEANRMIVLKEYSKDGTVTGTFDGWYVPGIRIEGSWINKKTKAAMPFKLKILNGTSENATWAGEWKRMDSGKFSPANLIIFNETGEDFEFQLDAYSGSHSGYLEGKAVIDGSKSKYNDKETGAVVLFVLKDGVLSLEANEKANGQAGFGVGYGGDYKKVQLNEEFTLLSTGIVKTKEQEKEMLQLVGKDSELLLNTAQFCSEEDDIDEFGSIVEKHWVRGLASQNESIIMFLPDGKLCLAVIDPSNNTVKVYTNAKYIQKVPKTIEKWKEMFKDFKVEFINKS